MSYPKTLAKLFWDTDLKALDPVKNATQIIERVLEDGSSEDFRWLKITYPASKIKKVIKTSRRLTPKSAIFWCLIYNIPFEETECLKKPYQKTGKKFWPS